MIRLNTLTMAVLVALGGLSCSRTVALQSPGDGRPSAAVQTSMVSGIPSVIAVENGLAAWSRPGASPETSPEAPMCKVPRPPQEENVCRLAPSPLRHDLVFACPPDSAERNESGRDRWVWTGVRNGS